MITIDLHLHTNFSDGKLPLRTVVDLYGKAGYDAIAITDHLCNPLNFLGFGARVLKHTLSEKNWNQYVLEIEKEKNRAWCEYKMIVFTGVEYTHNTFNHKRNAHMLAIDINKFVSPELDEVQWLKAVRELGALTIAAHPLKLKDSSSQTYYLINNLETFAPLVDLWEVANHKTLWRDMLKKQLPLIASSDFHGPANWAAWRTRISCEKDPEAIKSYLRDKNSQRDFVFINGNKSEIKTVISRTSEGGFSDSQYYNSGINGGWRPRYA